MEQKSANALVKVMMMDIYFITETFVRSLFHATDQPQEAMEAIAKTAT